jgi:hypothetical protein
VDSQKKEESDLIQSLSHLGDMKMRKRPRAKPEYSFKTIIFHLLELVWY